MKLRFIVGAVLFLFMIGCSTAPKRARIKQTRPANDKSKKTLLVAKEEISKGRKAQGIKRLQDLRAEAEGTDIEADIDILFAKEAIKEKNFARAGELYLNAKIATKDPKARGELCLLSTQNYLFAALPNKALEAIEECQIDNELSDKHKLALLEEKLRVLENTQDELSYLKAISDIIVVADDQKRELYRNKALNIIQVKLNKDQLIAIANDSDFGLFRGHAHYRLGQLALENQSTSEAVDHFQMVSQLMPATDLSESAESYIQQLEAIKKVNPMTVGAILPLTGRHANVGTKALRGIQLGLGLNGASPTPFKLAVIDSEANPDIARRGVERLVKEDNVIAIVGSLLSKTATAVATQAQELGVPTIALSQKSGLTQSGEFVFRNSLTTEAQVRFLVKYAVSELGIKRFAIMYPNDKFGIEYANVFWDEVLARGGEVRAAQTYASDEVDFKDQIKRLVGNFFLEDRMDEYRVAFSQWQAANPKKSSRQEVPADLLSPVTDFDAIFIADGIKALGQISSMLAYNNVKNVKLLGPNLWNTPAITKRLVGSQNQVVFVDNVQATIGHLQRNNFVKEFHALYGELPGPFEVQGYDAAIMIRQMLVEGASSRSNLQAQLAKAQKLPGALGSLNITPDREATRPIVALTVEEGIIKAIQQQ